MNQSTRLAIATSALAVLLTTGCGGDAAETTATDDQAPAAESPSAAGIRLVSAEEGAALQNDPPAGLVILDVRTEEEFDEGHLEGAIMIDFYREDFSDLLAELDPEVPYLLYCRSGNRSGQTATLMSELGFADVADVDGGILAWDEAGLPTVTP